MDLDFSDEQKALSAELSRFLSARDTRAGTRAALEAGGGYDADLWRGLSELGWPAAAIPERYGGMGLGPGMLCCVAAEIGKSLAAVPLASSIGLAAEAILLYGSDAQKAHWLPQLASGRAIGGFAIAEGPGAVSDAGISAEIVGDVLNGTKVAVGDGALCDVLIVVARRRGAACLCIVEARGEGVTVLPQPGIDPSHAPATVRFESARAEPMPGGAGGWDDVGRLMDRAAVYVAFEQVGTADAALETALAYARERRAFGRPIGSFQAIKHKLADVWTANELARANAYYAAWALEAGNDRTLALAAATARVGASEAATRAARELIQVHGGIAVTWEHDAHLYYRRSRGLSLMLGGPQDWQRQVVAGLRRRHSEVRP